MCIFKFILNSIDYFTFLFVYQYYHLFLISTNCFFSIPVKYWVHYICISYTALVWTAINSIWTISNLFILKSNDKKMYLSTTDFDAISYLASDINYTYFHFYTGIKKLSGYTIKHFENTLCSNKNFVRIHRKYIINRQFIKEITSSEVVLTCGTVLPIARRRRV